MSQTPDWFTWALAREPAPGQIDVAGCQIAYRRWGSPADPPVILVHGSSAGGNWWDHIAPFLAERNCVLAIDLSGHGSSGWRPSYSWAMWSAELQALAEEVTAESGPPVVIAHSMGGRVAIKAAAGMRSGLAGLIVVDTAIPVLPEQGTATNLAEAGTAAPRKIYPNLADAVARFRLRDVPATVALPYILRHVAETSTEALPDGVAWRRDARTSLRMDSRPDVRTLRQVASPIAWICAEHGKVTTEMRAAYPGILGRPVPIVEIPGAYHHVMMDRPLSLVTAMRALLAAWNHAAPR